MLCLFSAWQPWTFIMQLKSVTPVSLKMCLRHSERCTSILTSYIDFIIECFQISELHSSTKRDEDYMDVRILRRVYGALATFNLWSDRMNINLFTDLLSVFTNTRFSLFIPDCDKWFENQSIIVVPQFIATPPITPSTPETMSKFMDQKSYLICIRINHVLNKT